MYIQIRDPIREYAYENSGKVGRYVIAPSNTKEKDKFTQVLAPLLEMYCTNIRLCLIVAPAAAMVNTRAASDK